MKSISRITPNTFLSFVIFISVFFGCLYLGPLLFNSDGDLGRHLTVGRYIISTIRIPTLDIFSNSLFGSILIPHEWLAEVVFELAYKIMGLSGVVIFTSGLLGIVFWVVTNSTYQKCRSTPITLLLVLIGVAASRIHWLSRPHIFTYLFLLIWIAIFNMQLTFRKKFLLSICIMFLWVNTHGAFVYGFAYLGILILSFIITTIFRRERFWKANVLKELVGIGIGVFLITLINPSGWRIWQVVFAFLSNQYLVTHTAEYHPPILTEGQFIPFTILLLITISLIGLHFRKMSFQNILLLIVFGLMGIVSLRNIPIFVLVCLPILAGESSQLFPKFLMNLDKNGRSESNQLRKGLYKNWIPFIIVSIIVIFAGMIIRISPGLLVRNEFFPSKFPMGAVDWISKHKGHGNLFNQFEWGGYVLFRLWPDERVFIDGQTDFYGESLTRDYEAMINPDQGWESLS